MKGFFGRVTVIIRLLSSVGTCGPSRTKLIEKLNETPKLVMLPFVFFFGGLEFERRSGKHLN